MPVSSRRRYSAGHPYQRSILFWTNGCFGLQKFGLRDIMQPLDAVMRGGVPCIVGHLLRGTRDAVSSKLRDSRCRGSFTCDSWAVMLVFVTARLSRDVGKWGASQLPHSMYSTSRSRLWGVTFSLGRPAASHPRNPRFHGNYHAKKMANTWPAPSVACIVNNTCSRPAM